MPIELMAAFYAFIMSLGLTLTLFLTVAAYQQWQYGTGIYESLRHNRDYIPLCFVLCAFSLFYFLVVK